MREPLEIAPAAILVAGLLALPLWWHWSSSLDGLDTDSRIEPQLAENAD